MREEQARQAVLESIGEVAPEVDTTTIDGAVPLQDQLDIDSMDFLGVITAVYERTGVDIPERDYPQVTTLDATVAYIVERAA